LKARWAYPYRWGRKQSDSWDRETRFIYETYSMNRLVAKTAHLNDDLRQYAFNRWYNFWSAMAVEEIFGTHPRVISNHNRHDKLVDFAIDRIAFDHKTSVFPRGFGHPYDYARQHEAELIAWLYANQSQEGRMHLKNRLFIVLYDATTQQHWKLKAEIAQLQVAIERYLADFSASKLHRLDFGEGTVLSDIIWVTKGVG
jgi:hypothetical protein